VACARTRFGLINRKKNDGRLDRRYRFLESHRGPVRSNDWHAGRPDQYYHRSLTDYFDGLRAHHLAVTRLYEPPQMPYTESNDDFRQRIPKFLLIEAVPVA
jgi:hypothetical protein